MQILQNDIEVLDTYMPDFTPESLLRQLFLEYYEQNKAARAAWNMAEFGVKTAGHNKALHEDELKHLRFEINRWR